MQCPCQQNAFRITSLKKPVPKDYFLRDFDFDFDT